MANREQPLSPLLDDRQLAEILGVSPKTLANWRCSKRLNIPYIKLSRAVRYRRSDVDAYLNKRTVTSPLEERS